MQSGGSSARPGRSALGRQRVPASAPEAPPASNEVNNAREAEGERSARPDRGTRGDRRKPYRRLILAAVVVFLILGVWWWNARPTPVRVVRPQGRVITESIATSGEVTGQRVTAVGAQAQGIVTELRVREGSQVRAGEILARIRNEVAEAQVRQAEQALQTARAQLREAEAGARPSELQAAQARVTQAQATVAERRSQVDRARATLRQAEARLELARKDLERYRYLLSEKAVARQRVEQAETEYRVAQADVTAARESIESAEASLRAAQAQASQAQADLQTLRAGPRSEAVEVARQRVRDAESALTVARQQAENYVVRAPFDGTVIEIVAELGETVGAGGVVRLVETTRPEIRVDVDELNLAQLKIGQRAVVTSPTYRNAQISAQVTEISPSVDPTRGTVEVTLRPNDPPDWLRPGQTVNVNLIISEAVERLTVPRSAVTSMGGRSVVLLVHEGRAVAQPVITGEVAGDTVPVIEGLRPDDRVVLHADQVKPGERVRITGGG
jgi:HlyD family secretion protein